MSCYYREDQNPYSTQGATSMGMVPRDGSKVGETDKGAPERRYCV